jgi:hypothetical protein
LATSARIGCAWVVIIANHRNKIANSSVRIARIQSTSIVIITNYVDEGTISSRARVGSTIVTIITNHGVINVAGSRVRVAFYRVT